MRKRIGLVSNTHYVSFINRFYNTSYSHIFNLLVNRPYSRIINRDHSQPKRRNTRRKQNTPLAKKEKNIDETVKAKVDEIKDYIATSKTYNFKVRPRLNPFSTNDKDTEIELREPGSRVTEAMKWAMIAICSDMGARMLMKNFRDLFFKALITTQSYLNGFDRPVFTIKYFNKLWLTFLHRVKHKPERMSILFQPMYASHQRQSYIDSILEPFPTLLHDLYRYSTKVLGIGARTSAIINLMNRRSYVLYKDCPIRANLRLNKYHFWQFFHKFDGRLVRPVTKPRLTDEQKTQRVSWTKNMKETMEAFGDDFYVCFLDEKWFYTTSRRRKLKILPRAEFEEPEVAEAQMPKLRNRRFPLKVMFLGVIAPPDESRNFDGKILMKRVCEQYVTTKNSYNLHVASQYELNYELKRNEWRNLFDVDDDLSDMLVHEVLDMIRDAYMIDPGHEICFSYKTYSATGKSYTWKRLKVGDGFFLKNRHICSKSGRLRNLKVEDCILHRFLHAGMTLERDTTCDSKFMMTHIRLIGESIRKKYYWVEDLVPIFLIMDNAGGHGTTDTKEEYERILLDEFNVRIIWQVANSPETNMLDLGAWMSVQSHVEGIHKHQVMQNDVLAESCVYAFGELEESVLNNVYDRWVKVLDLIIKGDGDNNLVEKDRGKKAVVEEIITTDTLTTTLEQASEDEREAESEEEVGGSDIEHLSEFEDEDNNTVGDD